MFENDLVDIIDERMNILNSLEPLTGVEAEKFKKYYKIWHVYTTAALVGSSLNFLETKCILEDDMVVPGKFMSSHLQVVRLYAALSYIYECVKAGVDVTEDAVNNLCLIVTEPPSGKISGLLDWYNSNKDRLDTIELAIVFSFNLVYAYNTDAIAISLLLCNFILIKESYPLISIKPELKTEYLKSLNSYQTYSDFMLKILLQTINEYIDKLEY